MRRVLPRILFLAMLCFACGVASAGNHYILLIDSSGSMRETPAKAAAVRRALKDILIPRLRRRGFDSIPAFDSKNDLLTIHHFGMVGYGSNAAAWANARQVTMPEGFIHTSYRARPKVDPRGLLDVLLPKIAYRLTALSWARPLGLVQSKAAQSRVQRTFMIVVTDALPNGGSLSDEAFWMETKAPDAIAKYVDRERSGVADLYLFTNGRQSEAIAWKDHVGAGDTSGVWIAAQEIVSRRRLDWLHQGQGLVPFATAEADWQSQGKQPVALFETRLTPQLREWLKQGNFVRASLDVKVGSGKGHADWDGKSDTVSAEIIFPNGLPGGDLLGSATLHVTARKPDHILGISEHTVDFKQNVFLPNRTLGSRLAAFGNVLGAFLLLGLAGWLYLSWKFVTHLRFRLPGFGGRPGKMNPVGSASLPIPEQVILRPVGQGEALSVVVPNPLMRWLFYRKATMSVTASSGEVAWEQTKSPEIAVPTMSGKARAVWLVPPTTSAEVKVTLTRPDGQTYATIQYPGPQPMTSTDPKRPRYIVSLDLGSESMAAYYEVIGETPDALTPIDLQERARVVVVDPRFIDGNERARRLSTRLMAKQVTTPFDENHAKLVFFEWDQAGVVRKRDDYDLSRFEYFISQTDHFDPSRSIPNPKVCYQKGSLKLLPGFLQQSATRIKPDTIMLHLATQVILNFVMDSNALRGVPREEIELLLTVPNVYSNEHSETLRDAVQRFTGAKEVNIISESDALVYFHLYRKTKGTVYSGKKSTTTDPVTQRYITLDVGKGTTDLSVIDITPGEKRIHPTVQARTGISSGGSELTYIFAQYFRREIDRVCSLHGVRFKKGASLFDEDDSGSGIQQQAPYFRSLEYLERICEITKRQCDENGLVVMAMEDETKGALQEAISELAGFITTNLESDAPTGFFEGIEQALDLRGERINVFLRREEKPAAAAEEIKSKFVRWFYLIRGKLGPVSRSVESLAKPKPALPSKPKASADPKKERQRNLDQLGVDVANYIGKNIDQTLVDLSRMVMMNQQQRKGAPLKKPIQEALEAMILKNKTVFVVGGQASSFRPLRAHLDSIVKPHRDTIQYEPLKADELKPACSIGAVLFSRSGHELDNADGLHGTYAVYAVGSRKFIPLDNRLLNTGRTQEITINPPEAFLVVYAPKIIDSYDLADPSICVAGEFEMRDEPTTFEARLEKRGKRRVLMIRDEQVKLPTFGDTGKLVDLYKMVWPQRLKPKDVTE